MLLGLSVGLLDSCYSSGSASIKFSGPGSGATLSDPVPWFVAKEANDSSGPVEAAGISWLAGSRPHLKFVLRTSFLSENSVDLA